MTNSVKEEISVATIIEESVTRNLATRNITNEVIERYSREYMQLKINGIKDTDGYKAVYDARQIAKKTRIVIKEICEEGRAPLQAETKEWIKKEKELVAKVVIIEEYLQKQEDEYNSAKEQIRIDKEKADTDRLRVRDEILVSLGARCNGIDYLSDELVFSLSVIKGSDEIDFTSKIVPQFKAIFEAKENIRIANEKALREQKEREDRERKERDDKERKDREDLEKQQKELREAQAKIDRENARIEKEKQDTIAEKLKEEQDEINRQNEVAAKELKRQQDELKAAQEKIRLAEEAEEKRKLDIETGKDKVKYAEMVSYLKATPIYDMRSSQYRTKAAIIRDFLSDLN